MGSEDDGDESKAKKEELECDDVKITERGRVCKEVYTHSELPARREEGAS